MDVIFWIFLVAMATSITFIYEVISPVLQKLKQEKPKHNMVEYWALTYAVFFFLGMLAFPILLPVCLVPSMGTKVRDQLLESFLQD